jgi:hypothetical protein
MLPLDLDFDLDWGRKKQLKRPVCSKRNTRVAHFKDESLSHSNHCGARESKYPMHAPCRKNIAGDDNIPQGASTACRIGSRGMRGRVGADIGWVWWYGFGTGVGWLGVPRNRCICKLPAV